MPRSTYKDTTYLPHQSAFLWNIQQTVGSTQTGQWAGLVSVNHAHKRWLNRRSFVLRLLHCRLAIHCVMSQERGKRSRPLPLRNTIGHISQTGCTGSMFDWATGACQSPEIPRASLEPTHEEIWLVNLPINWPRGLTAFRFVHKWGRSRWWILLRGSVCECESCLIFSLLSLPWSSRKIVSYTVWPIG